jgi:hypothetical protein
VVALCIKLFHKIKIKLSGRPSAEAIADQMLIAYHTLAGPMLDAPTIRAAFQRAAAKGCIDHAVLTILDHVADNPPTFWENGRPLRLGQLRGAVLGIITRAAKFGRV